LSANERTVPLRGVGGAVSLVPCGGLAMRLVGTAGLCWPTEDEEMTLRTMRTALASATALGLMMGVAMADDNWSSVKQRGDGNDADITQLGQNNEVRGLQGQVGTDGNNNVLVVDQNGTNNRAGHKLYDDWEWTLRQYGHNNLINIEQTGNGN